MCQNTERCGPGHGYVPTWMVYHNRRWRSLSLPILYPSVDLFHLCSQKSVCVLGWSVSNMDDGFCHCINVSIGCPVGDVFNEQDKICKMQAVIYSHLESLYNIIACIIFCHHLQTFASSELIPKLLHEPRCLVEKIRSVTISTCHPITWFF